MLPFLHFIPIQLNRVVLSSFVSGLSIYANSDVSYITSIASNELHMEKTLYVRIIKDSNIYYNVSQKVQNFYFIITIFAAE
jgi:hypothetical protein